jgi:hypothetical protein
MNKLAYKSYFVFKCLAQAYIFCYTVFTQGVALFPGSSVVEQAAVNRLVAGSSPARGAITF